MDPLNLVKDVELAEDGQADQYHRLRRILFLTFTVLVLIMTIIYLVSSPGMLDIIAGILVSDQLDEDLTLHYQQYTIRFDGKVYHDLRSFYLANQQHEFKVCLTGEKQGNMYHLTGYYVPIIFSQSVFEVVSSGCGDTSLVSLHSHPYKHCVFSEKDIISYHREQQGNPDVLLGLMCTLDRFTFYRE